MTTETRRLKHRDAVRLDNLQEDAIKLMTEMGHDVGEWFVDTFSSRVAECDRCGVTIGIDADPLLLRQIGKFPPETGIYSAGLERYCTPGYYRLGKEA